MTRVIIVFTAVVLLVGVYGCSKPAGSDKTAPVADGSADEHQETGTLDTDDMTDMEKMKVELAKLSPEDAASAMSQHFCPVSDEMLGVMGPPIKVDVNGKEVWICCEGCKEKLLASPEEYLAKLEAE